MSYNNQQIYKSNLTYVIGSAYPLNEVNQFLISLKSDIQYIMEDTFRKPKLTADRIMNILRYILTHPDILAYVEEAMEKERRQILGIPEDAQVMNKIVNENENSIEEGELTDTPNKNPVQKHSEISHNINKSTIIHNNSLNNEIVSDLKTVESPGCKRKLLKEMTISERNKEYKLIMVKQKPLSTKDKGTNAEKRGKTQEDENQSGSDDKRNRCSADRVNKTGKSNEDKEYRSSSEKEGKNSAFDENRRSFSNERSTHRQMNHREKSTSREKKITEKRGLTDSSKKKRTTTESDNERYSSVKRKRTNSAYNVKASYNKSNYRSPRKTYFQSRHSSFSRSSNVRQKSRSLSSRRNREHVREKSVRKNIRSPRKESSKTCSDPDLDEFQKANRKTYDVKVRSVHKSHNSNVTPCQSQKRAIGRIEDKSDERIPLKKIKPCKQNDAVNEEVESAEEGELEDEVYTENADVNSPMNIDHEVNKQSKSGKIDISLENITSDDAMDLNASSTSTSTKIMSPLVPSESKNAVTKTSENAFTLSKIVPNHSEIVQTDLVIAKSPSRIETPKHNISLSTENKESPGSGLKEKQKSRKKKPLTYYISCKVKSPSTSATAADISDLSTSQQETEKVENLSESSTEEKNALPCSNTLEEKLESPLSSDNIENKTDLPKLQNLAKPSNYCDMSNSNDVVLSGQLFNDRKCKENESSNISQIPLFIKDNLTPIKMLPDHKKQQKVTSSTSTSSNIFIDNNKLVDYDELNYETLELSPKTPQHTEFSKVPSANSHRRKSPSPMKYEREKVYKFSRFKKEEPKPFKSLYTKRMEIKIKALQEIENAQSSSTPPSKKEENTIVKKKRKKSAVSLDKTLPIKVSTKNSSSKAAAIHSSEKSPSLCSSNVVNMTNSNVKSISKALQSDVSTVNPSKDKSIAKSSSTHSDSCLPWELSCSEMPTLNSPEKLCSTNSLTKNSLTSSVEASNSKLVHDTPIANSPTKQMTLSSLSETDFSSTNDNINLSSDIPDNDSPIKMHTVDLTHQNLIMKSANEVSDLNTSSEIVLSPPFCVSNTPKKVPDEDSSDKVSSKISSDETFIKKSPVQVPHSDSFDKVTPACFSNDVSSSLNDATNANSSINAISTVSPTESISSSPVKTSTIGNPDSPHKSSVSIVPNKTDVISKNDSLVKEKDDLPKMEGALEENKEIWTKADDREILSTCKTYGPSQISFQMVANALKSNKTPEQIKARFEFLMDMFKRKMLQKAMNKTQ